MEFLRAFTYVFQDRHWLGKLAETALFVILCPLPIVGVFSFCVLLGYLIQIIHNVSNDYPRPLPEWDHIGENVGKGFPVLLAIILYHAPAMIALALLYAFRNSIAVSLFGGITFIGVFTAALPFLLLYCAFAWSLLAIAIVRYAETWETDSFYQIDRLLRSLQTDGVITLQWLVAAIAASILLLMLLPVALLGLVLCIPVHGYLTGSYGRRLRASKLRYRRGLA